MDYLILLILDHDPSGNTKSAQIHAEPMELEVHDTRLWIGKYGLRFATEDVNGSETALI